MSKLALFTVLSTALAANIDVQVGQGGLKYSPSKVTANAGDTITFHYVKGFHSVTQSSFDAPCQHLTGGFNSGIVPAASSGNAPTFVITVKDSSPLWVYCAQEGHCQGGMAMVVNEPSGKTLESYQSAAQNAAQQSADSTVAGGVISTSGGSSSTASSSSTSMSSSSASTTSSSSSGSTTLAGAGSGSTTVSSSGTAATTSATSTSGTSSSGTTSGTTSASPSSTTGAANHEAANMLALMGAAAFGLFL